MPELLNLVSKPRASDEDRKDIVALLRRTLAEAEAGELDTVILLARRPDGYWAERYSGVSPMTDLIGRLTIVQAQMVRRYLDLDGVA